MSRYLREDWLKKQVHDVPLANGAVHGCIDKLALCEAPSVDIIHCTECKFQPIQPNHYSWCEVFARSQGYCPFGQRITNKSGSTKWQTALVSALEVGNKC